MTVPSALTSSNRTWGRAGKQPKQVQRPAEKPLAQRNKTRPASFPIFEIRQNKKQQKLAGQFSRPLPFLLPHLFFRPRHKKGQNKHAHDKNTTH
jgi:hypothetical protein